MRCVICKFARRDARRRRGRPGRGGLLGEGEGCCQLQRLIGRLGDVQMGNFGVDSGDGDA